MDSLPPNFYIKPRALEKGYQFEGDGGRGGGGG